MRLSLEILFRADVASPLAGDAADWVVKAHSGVSAIASGTLVELRSARHSSDELETIWLCALANEQLFHANKMWRDGLLDELLR
jgi:hypothetical protein